MTLKDVEVARLDPGRFQAVLDPDACRRFLDRLKVAADRLAGRRLWQVNSTEQGGGVAEMLYFLLGYLAGAGIDTRWVVIEGNQECFAVTKRIHHLLHGQPGDEGQLDEPARTSYRQTLKETLGELEQRVEPGDVVILHDPQTAGLAPALKRQGATVVWSCHVGTDTPNDLARTAWEFLRPSVQQADAYVFSRAAYRWEGLERARLAVIAPCIDAFAPKNQPLEATTVNAILHRAGILEDPDAKVRTPEFQRLNGRPGRVVRRAKMIHQPIPPGSRWVVQVSRWDRLKEPLGCWRALSVTSLMRWAPICCWPGRRRPRSATTPKPTRSSSRSAGPGRRCHVVNAIQRRADVIVQKSLAEGFGLTVAEAMWKARPVLASRVGASRTRSATATAGCCWRTPATWSASVGGSRPC